jgi:histidyl-tRNA synthetase
MRDLLPPETEIWTAVERTARRIFSSYGFEEIRTPLVEETELFVRSVGESTDIVGKEMFTFADRRGKSLSLRPESTASVARAFVQHGLAQRPQPLRLFYMGPHFRYERPQKGRYRQFWQIGAELIGDPGPWSDVEVVAMLVRFLRELGFEDVEALVNTVGDPESRRRYIQHLRAFLEPRAHLLGDDSRRRLDSNPLRILDTKVPAEQEMLADAPKLADSLNEESRSHFDDLQRGLGSCGVSYRVDDRLVRGLDYYTRTVFEIVSPSLGAQNALVGGGRYDGLIAQVGGNETPGIGFAIGLDRIVEALPDASRLAIARDVFLHVVPMGQVAAPEALRLCEELRSRGLRATAELAGASSRSALRRASRQGVSHVIFLGDDEIATDTLSVKSFASGEQAQIARAEIVEHLGTASAPEDVA